MEDAHSFVYDYAGVRGQGYFAVFDGHAGKHAAEWCGQNFHEVSAATGGLSVRILRRGSRIGAGLAVECQGAQELLFEGEATLGFIRLIADPAVPPRRDFVHTGPTRPRPPQQDLPRRRLAALPPLPGRQDPIGLHGRHRLPAGRARRRHGAERVCQPWSHRSRAHGWERRGGARGTDQRGRKDPPWVDGRRERVGGRSGQRAVETQEQWEEDQGFCGQVDWLGREGRRGDRRGHARAQGGCDRAQERAWVEASALHGERWRRASGSLVSDATSPERGLAC